MKRTRRQPTNQATLFDRKVEKTVDLSELQQAKRESLNTPQNKILNEEYEKQLNILSNFQEGMVGESCFGICANIPSCFIMGRTLYAILGKDKKQYRGRNVITGKTITVKKKDVTKIAKDEPLLVYYYMSLNTIKSMMSPSTISKIPFNTELNEFHEKWRKYGLIFANKYFDFTNEMIIKYYEKK